MTESGRSSEVQDVIWKASVALNRVAGEKINFGPATVYSIEACAQILADMPEEALQSILRTRNNGKSSSDREIHQGEESPVQAG